MNVDNIKAYFDKQAQSRIKYRKSKSYYWNSITKYCDYFIHDEYSVLEIGCGTGELIYSVKGDKKVGIDFSEKMIDEAKKQFPDMDFRVMEAENLDLDEKFDVIILSNLIGFLDDIEYVFK